MAWDDEKKNKAVELYLGMKPTPETSMECVKEVATKLGETPNGVRMVLSKMEVYVKKEATKTEAKGASADGEKPKTTRVSKEGSQASLTDALEKAGVTVDTEIVSKLTGKAAVYFTNAINQILKDRE